MQAEVTKKEKQLNPNYNPDVARITEIFKSVQGESLFCGQVQIFCRFSGGCKDDVGKYMTDSVSKKIFCKWCDESSSSLNREEFARIEKTPNKRDWVNVPIEMTIKEIADHIRALEPESCHSLSLTGGEPLAFPDQIRKLHEELGNVVPFYLETNGLRPVELEEVVDLITYVTPDIKIPSSLGGVNYFEYHKQFLDVCQRYKKKTTVKSVITSKITEEDIQMLIELLKPYFKDPNFDLDFCLQPVTPYGAINAKYVPSQEMQFEIQTRMTREGVPTRCMGQMHKMMGYI